MREIHSLEDIDETIEEGAEPEFSHRIEIGERLQAAKKNCGGLGIVVQGSGQIAPLLSESMDGRLPAFFCLLPNLDCQVNERRNSDEHRGQLADCCQHLPIHTARTRE